MGNCLALEGGRLLEPGTPPKGPADQPGGPTKSPGGGGGVGDSGGGGGSGDAAVRVSVKAHEKGYRAGGTYVPLSVRCERRDGEHVVLSCLVDVWFVEDDPSLEEVREVLEEDLQAVSGSIPPKAMKKIADSTILWVNHGNGMRGAQAHMAKDFKPVKGAAPRPFNVEVNNWKDYMGGISLNRADVLLHEFAHAFNYSIGRNHPQIVDLFEQGKASGKYESVQTVFGDKRERAYGLQNEFEFFASLSVPLLGGSNDYEPFTHRELLRFDPAIVPKLWAIWSLAGDEPRKSSLK